MTKFIAILLATLAVACDTDDRTPCEVNADAVCATREACVSGTSFDECRAASVESCEVATPAYDMERARDCEAAHDDLTCEAWRKEQRPSCGPLF